MNSQVCVICGMNINEKNYNFNREAFIDENKLDNIKYCPFCGVTELFIKLNEKPYDFHNVDLNIDELKIIDHAVKLEIFNGDFYEKAAKMAEDENVKNMFKSLSNIEFMHAKIHAKIGGFKEAPKLRDMDYSKYKTEEELLQQASIREKHAVDYYLKYSKEIKSKLIRDIFQALADVETLHIQITKSI